MVVWIIAEGLLNTGYGAWNVGFGKWCYFDCHVRACVIQKMVVIGMILLREDFGRIMILSIVAPLLHNQPQHEVGHQEVP